MKKLQFFLAVLLCSCASQKNIELNQVQTNLHTIKFPRYGDFYWSDSTEANFEYENLGKIYSLTVLDYNEGKKGANLSNHDIANQKKAIDKLYNNAINIGADGLIDFKLEYVQTIPPSIYSSGYAIKRKSK